jgi:hypothetical protein
MGEKIIALAGKLGVDADSVSLARVYVPPHTRVSKGQTINVDGYWREAGDISQLFERERKAISGQKDLTNASPGDEFSFLDGSMVAHGTVMEAGGPDGDVQVQVRNGSRPPYTARLPRDTSVMSFRPGFGKVPEPPKLRESKPDPARPIKESDVEEALNDPRHYGYGYSEIDMVSEKKRGVANRAIAKAMQQGGFDREDLFQWVNSKFGRWYAEGVYDGQSATALAKKIADEVNQLKKEGYE